jgi:SAM-dependent methyltransferase
MERLALGVGTRYSSLEAAIHYARYSLARTLCPGRRVLDFACGEGYGSWLMSMWGASEVTGVDVSKEAIDAASSAFSRNGLAFARLDASELSRTYSPGSFDLIICLETIEHVPAPTELLEAFKTLLVPGGAIVVSCPNDHLYFPEFDQSNPYHLRKYRFDEFVGLSESVLGSADGWLFGTQVGGFCNVQFVRSTKDGDPQDLMLESRQINTCFVVPVEEAYATKSDQCAYFVGVWGKSPVQMVESAALIPLSQCASNTDLNGDTFRHLKAVADDLRGKLDVGWSEQVALRQQIQQLQVETLVAAHVAECVTAMASADVGERADTMLETEVASPLEANALHRALADALRALSRERAIVAERTDVMSARLGQIESSLRHAVEREGEVAALRSESAEARSQLATALLALERERGLHELLNEAKGKLDAELASVQLRLDAKEREVSAAVCGVVERDDELAKLRQALADAKAEAGFQATELATVRLQAASFAEELSRTVASLGQMGDRVSHLEDALGAESKKSWAAQLRLNASSAENEYMRDQIWRIKQHLEQEKARADMECAERAVIAAKFERIRSLVPAPLRRISKRYIFK